MITDEQYSPILPDSIRSKVEVRLHEPCFGWATVSYAGVVCVKSESVPRDIFSAAGRALDALSFALFADQSGEH